METTRRRRRWSIQRLFDPSGREMLYLLSFYLPRFLDYPFEEKAGDRRHELWHIGPAFDGDLRGMPAAATPMGTARASIMPACSQLAASWLAQNPPIELYEFLRCDFRQCASVSAQSTEPGSLRRNSSPSRQKPAEPA